MLTLNDGRTELWQWDTGRTLSVDADCSQVHFSNKVFGRSIDVDVTDGVAIIPDILLQTDKDLNVWAFVGTAENGYTKISKTFKVNRRNKPADYVFTPTDQMTLHTIQRQIGDLADLTTEEKTNLVVAINEVARTGGVDVSGAQVGQAIVVKAVDENGKPTEWAAADIPSGAQPDWNQNDDTQPGYIKNRPFYTGAPVETVVVEERTVTFVDHGGLYMANFPSTFMPTVGETYKVYWDGTAYECICVDVRGTPGLGNLSIAGAGPDTGEPFAASYDGTGFNVGTTDTSASHAISISGLVREIVKIDAKYLPLPFKPDGISYLTFSSRNSFSLSIRGKSWDGTLEYFASDGTWAVWDGSSFLSAEANGSEYVLYLRGTGNTVISDELGWILKGFDISCIGNIETLLDYATVESGGHPVMARNCYSSMFYGCTSLTRAPELPATTLADYCYAYMFYGCTSLTQAPALPATTLAERCYAYMFQGCTSLTQAPALPATTLANGCYDSMFEDCTSLTQAPTLPATTLASSCYYMMFYGCTSLKLSETKTEEYTQEYRIPLSGNGTDASAALAEMFISTGGTFTGTPAINTTYYLSSDNMIVRGNDIANLNGYVKSMIDNAGECIPVPATAEVGQTIVVKAVDANGKPTEWAAADMASGADGKSAYAYAVEGGYTGTEAEFAAKLAAEIPVVDATLTQSGQAADAAAVGDRLSALSEEKVSLPKDDTGAVQNGTNGQILQTNGDGTTQWVDKPEGGGGTSSETTNIPVTAEKAFAASVLELNHVADNQYVAQHDSVLFEATEDTALSVGSDNLIGSPYSERVNDTVNPAIAYTEIENGYALAYADDFTGTKTFQNQRFGFDANIKSGNTYTLRFYVNAESVGNVYLYLTNNKTAVGKLVGGGNIRTGTVCQITFTADADYAFIRVPIAYLPAEITKITLCEGEVPLEYGGGAKSYALLAGEKVWLSGVRKMNCVGTGKFYESPLALTSLNGIPTQNGAINSCATNKVWVNMGDSIWTFGASTGGIGTITDYMIALCGGTWHNIATGGTTMASRPGSYAGTYDALDFWKIADAIVAGNYTDAKAAAAELTSNFANIDNVNWSAVDYVTVAYGTNDLAFGAEIDNASNLFDTATICGALRYGIKAINSAYPNIRFKVLGVLYRNADSVSMTKIVECNNALKDAAAYVGAEFIDGYGINEGNRSTYLYDGTHPNGEGKQRIAETLARSIHDVWYS